MLDTEIEILEQLSQEGTVPTMAIAPSKTMDLVQSALAFLKQRKFINKTYQGYEITELGRRELAAQRRAKSE